MKQVDNLNDMMSLSGMERLKHFKSQTKRTGMAGNLGYDVISVQAGKVVYQYQLQDRHVNLIGSLHGGIIASLVDTAMGGAVLTLLEPDEWHTMTDLSVKFIGAVRNKEDILTIEATVDHSGRRMFATEARVYNQKNKLIARSIANAIRIKQ